MGHVAHHVAHGQGLEGIGGGHGCRESGPHGERAAHMAGACHGLGIEGAGVVAGGDEHVVGFTGAEAEFVHRDGFHPHAVGRHHAQGQAGDAHVVEGVGGCVDAAQAHSLPLVEQAGPVAARGQPVHEAGERGTRDIGQVGGAHAHGVPHAAHGHGLVEPVVGHIAGELCRGGLAVVVVAALLAQAHEHAHGIGVGPVGELDDVVAVGPDVVGRIGGVDDDGAVHAGELLHARVRVVPVGAVLAHAEAVGEGLPRRDAGKAHPGNAVHLVGELDAVPVDGGGLAQAVGDADRHGVALAPAQHGAGKRAVDDSGHARSAGEVDGSLGHHQIELRAAQLRRRAAPGTRHGGRCGGVRHAGRAQPQQPPACGHAQKQAAAGEVGRQKKRRGRHGKLAGRPEPGQEKKGSPIVASGPPRKADSRMTNR